MARITMRRIPLCMGMTIFLAVLAGCSLFKKAPSPEAGAPGTPEAGAAPAPEVPVDLPTRAQKAFEGRAVKEGTLEAIRLWEQALAEDPKRVDVLRNLTRAHVWLASEQTTVPAEREKFLLKAKGYAERGLAVDKKDIGTKYWLAESLDHLSNVAGKVDRTLHRYKGKAKGLFQEVLDTDETYYYGGAHRFFGVFHAEGSAISGATFSKSYMHFNRAIDIEPRFFPTYLQFVQVTLLRNEQKAKTQIQQDRAEARKYLRYVLETPSSSLPEAMPENELAKVECRKILEKEFNESL